jgi:hypothetical protein
MQLWTVSSTTLWSSWKNQLFCCVSDYITETDSSVTYHTSTLSPPGKQTHHCLLDLRASKLAEVSKSSLLSLRCVFHPLPFRLPLTVISFCESVTIHSSTAATGYKPISGLLHLHRLLSSHVDFGWSTLLLPVGMYSNTNLRVSASLAPNKRCVHLHLLYTTILFEAHTFNPLLLTWGIWWAPNNASW